MYSGQLIVFQAALCYSVRVSISLPSRGQLLVFPTTFCNSVSISLPYRWQLRVFQATFYYSVSISLPNRWQLRVYFKLRFITVYLSISLLYRGQLLVFQATLCYSISTLSSKGQLLVFRVSILSAPIVRFACTAFLLYHMCPAHTHNKLSYTTTF